ncbi:MAG: hypothetical protein ABJA62_00615 [Luteimonas sp.]
MSLLSLLVLRHTSLVEMQRGTRRPIESVGKTSIKSKSAPENPDIARQVAIATTMCRPSLRDQSIEKKKGNP